MRVVERIIVVVSDLRTRVLVVLKLILNKHIIITFLPLFEYLVSIYLFEDRPFTPGVDAAQAGMVGGVANCDPAGTAKTCLRRNKYIFTRLRYGVRAASSKRYVGR